MRVAGFFQAHPGGCVEQALGQQVVGVLRTHRDQDFLGQGEDAALGQQAQSDLLDQVGYVVGFEVGCPVLELCTGERA